MSRLAPAAAPPVWREAAVGIALCVLSGYCGAGLPVFRDTLRDHFGVTDRLLGLLFSIGLIPGALAAFAAGLATSRWGAGRLIAPAAASLALAYLIAAIVPRYSGLLLACVIAAVASQFIFLTVQSRVVDLFPGRGRRTMSLFLAGTTLGCALFPLAAEALLQLSRRAGGVPFAWVLHAPFGILAVLTILVALPLRRVAATRPAAPRVPGPQGRHALSFTPAGLALILLMTLHTTADNLYVMWLPRVLDSSSFPVRPLSPGPVLAAASFVYVAARLLLAFAPEHRGRRTALVAPYLIGSALLLAAVVGRSQAAAGAAYVFGSLLWSAGYPTQLALLVEVERGRFAAAAAAALLIMGVLTTILSCAMGALADAVGESRLWLILLVPVTVTLLTGLGNAAWIRVAGRGMNWRGPARPG